MTNKKLELLAPAGNFVSLHAAINAGADAVYFGIKDFNMRARAKNFKLTDLKKIKELCTNNKNNPNKIVKRYLTLNTIIYDNELDKIEKIIIKVKPFIDAIIVSDISVMLLCKKHKIPFHVSTQMSVSNSESAKFFKKLGAKRIVLARELSLKQIKNISKIIDTEIFIHGAMCISISGRCLLSQFMSNNSANRGACIQPCRRYYNITDTEGNSLKIDNHHVLSPKDLCTLPFFDKIKKCGAISFKIEGRNKEPEYVDTVVSVYRQALDKNLTKNEIKDLTKKLDNVYNKGFSSGFYFKMPSSDDFSDVQHSKSKKSKIFIGKISHYYKKISVGLLKLNNNELNIGDEILILGKTTGLIRTKIKAMQIDHKPVTIVKKGLDVGIKLPFCRKNDEIYKVIRKES